MKYMSRKQKWKTELEWVNASKLFKCLCSYYGVKFYTQVAAKRMKSICSSYSSCRIFLDLDILLQLQQMVPSSQRKSLSKCLLVAALLSARLRSEVVVPERWKIPPRRLGLGPAQNAGAVPLGEQTRTSTPTRSWSSWGGASLTHFPEVPGHPLPPVEQRSFNASSLPQHDRPTKGWYSSWPRRDEPFATELSFGHLQPERWHSAEDGTKNLAIHVQASLRAALN